MPSFKYRLDKEFSLSGHFQSDGVTDDRQVAANLNYRRSNGISLELYDKLFADVRPSFLTPNNAVPRITGQTKDDEHVVLLNSYRGSSKTNFATGRGYETYRPQHLLISERSQPATEAIKFRTSFQGLELWLGKRFAEVQPSSAEDAEIVGIVKISRHKELAVQVPSIQAAMETDGEVKFQDASVTSFSAQHTGVIDIITMEKKELGWFLEQGRILRNLACLCLGMFLPLRFNRLHNGTSEFAGRSYDDWSCVVYWQLEEDEWKEDSLPIFPVFTFTSLQSIQPDFMDRWFALYSKAKESLDIFFAIQRGGYRYIDTRFLMSMQALESYSRLTASPPPVDAEQAQQLRDKVLASLPAEVPEEMRSRIIGAMRMADEPSLRRRLNDMVVCLTPIFGSNPLGFTSKFRNRLIATRNYLTHYGNKSGDVLELFEMEYACRRMRVFLAALLFLDIGLNHSSIKQGIDNARGDFWAYDF